MRERVAAGLIERPPAIPLWATLREVDERVTAFAKVREEVPEGTRTRVFCDVWVDKEDGTRILVGDASALAEE